MGGGRPNLFALFIAWGISVGIMRRGYQKDRTIVGEMGGKLRDDDEHDEQAAFEAWERGSTPYKGFVLLAGLYALQVHGFLAGISVVIALAILTFAVNAIIATRCKDSEKKAWKAMRVARWVLGITTVVALALSAGQIVPRSEPVPVHLLGHPTSSSPAPPWYHGQLSEIVIIPQRADLGRII